MEHVVWSRRPALTRPTLVAAFAGWNDAGDAATFAVRHLIEEWGAEPFARHRSRGVLRLPVHPAAGRAASTGTPGASSGRPTRPTPRPRPAVTSCCSSASSRSCGGAPSRTRSPAIAEETGARLVVTLGALLADVVHRRPVALIGTATDQTLIDRYDLQRSRYEGPTGIVGVLHDTCQPVGLDSLSLWAAVPAYASQVPSPKAAIALGEGACEVVGVPVPGRPPGGGGGGVRGPDRALPRAGRRAGRATCVASTSWVTTRTRTRAKETDAAGDAEIDADVSAQRMMEDIERFLRDQGNG